MDSRDQAHHPDGQPAFDVTQQPGLEAVVPDQSEFLPEVRADQNAAGGKEYIPTQYPKDFSSTVPTGLQPLHEPAPPAQGGRSRRFWIVVGAAVAIVVIIAAVLGGVLGTKRGGDSGNNNSSNNATISPGPPQTIRQGSKLSITGLRKPDRSLVTYLIYQDQNDSLWYSKCDSGTPRAGIDNTTCWQAPVNLGTKGYAETALAASTIIWGGDNEFGVRFLFSTDPFPPSAFARHH